jgi:predicted amidophosphoribosyltransferase
MQIAGNKCKVCERNIILSTEGKYCARCGTVVHRACEAQAKCEVCSDAYQAYERAEVDPLSEAILPRKLRPAKSAGPTLAILLTTVLGLLAVILWYSIEYALAHSLGK